MGSTNNFKASIIIAGEIGASFRSAMRGAAKETDLVGDKFRELQKVVAAGDRALERGAKKLKPAALNRQLVDLENQGIDTSRLEQEISDRRKQLQQLGEQKNRIDNVKGSVVKLGSAWKAVRGQITSTSIALGVLTAGAYGIFRFTRSIVDFNNSARVFRNFDYAVMRLRFNIAYALMPAVGNALNKLGDFFNRNREQITSVFKELGRTIEEVTPLALGILHVMLGVGQAIAAISRAIPWWVKIGAVLAVGAVGAATFAYKVYLLGSALMGSASALRLLLRGGHVFAVLRFGITRLLIPAVTALGGAIEAVGAAIAATPIGWIVAIGAAIVGVTYLVYRNWGPIKTFFKAVFSDPIRSVKELWATIRNMFTWIRSNPVQFWEASKGGKTGKVGAISGLANIAALLPHLPFFLLRSWASKISRPQNTGDQPPAASAARPKQVSQYRPNVSQSINVTVHAAPGQSANEIAAAVIEQLKRKSEQVARLAPSTSHAFA